jgi:hypothetical protein
MPLGAYVIYILHSLHFFLSIHEMQIEFCLTMGNCVSTICFPWNWQTFTLYRTHQVLRMSLVVLSLPYVVFADVSKRFYFRIDDFWRIFSVLWRATNLPQIFQRFHSFNTHFKISIFYRIHVFICAMFAFVVIVFDLNLALFAHGVGSMFFFSRIPDPILWLPLLFFKKQPTERPFVAFSAFLMPLFANSHDIFLVVHEQLPTINVAIVRFRRH